MQAETASCADTSNCLINLVCMTMQIQVFNLWGCETALYVTACVWKEQKQRTLPGWNNTLSLF